MNQNTNPPSTKMKVLSKAALKYYPEDLIKKVEKEEQQQFHIESLQSIHDTSIRGPPSRKGRKRIPDNNSTTNTQQNNDSSTGRASNNTNQKLLTPNNSTNKSKSTPRTRKREGGVGLSATEQNVLKILAANAHELGNQKVPPITIQRSQSNVSTARIVQEKQHNQQPPPQPPPPTNNVKGITNEHPKNNISPQKTIIPRTAGHHQTISAVSKASFELTPNITPNIRSNITKRDVDLVPQLAPQRNKSLNRISVSKIEPEIVRTVPKLANHNSQTTPIVSTHLVISPPPKRTTSTPMQRIQPVRPIISPEQQTPLKVTTTHQQQEIVNNASISPNQVQLVNKQSTLHTTQSNTTGHSTPTVNVQVSSQQQMLIEQQMLQQQNQHIKQYSQNQAVKEQLIEQQPHIRVQKSNQAQNIQQQIQISQQIQQKHIQQRQIQQQENHQQQQLQQIQQQQQLLQLQQQSQNQLLASKIQLQETIQKLQEQQKLQEKLILEQKIIEQGTVEKLLVEEDNRLSEQQKFILDQNKVIEQQSDIPTTILYTPQQGSIQTIGNVSANISHQNIPNIQNQQTLQDIINQLSMQNAANQQNQKRLLEQQRFQQETEMVREHMGRMIVANNLNQPQPWQNRSPVSNQDLLNYLVNQFASINPQILNQFPIGHDALQQLSHGKSDQAFQRMLIQHLVNQLHLLLNQTVSPNNPIITQRQTQSNQQNQNIQDNTNVNMSNTNSEHHQQQIAFNTALNNLAAAGITDENRIRLQQEYAAVIRSFQEEESKKQKAEEDRKKLEEMIKKQQGEEELKKMEAEKQRLQAEDLMKHQEVEKRQIELERIKKIEAENKRTIEEERKRMEEKKRLKEEKKKHLKERMEEECNVNVQQEVKKLVEIRKTKQDDSRKFHKIQEIHITRLPQIVDKTRNILIENKKASNVEERQKRVVEEMHNKIKQEVRQQQQQSVPKLKIVEKVIKEQTKEHIKEKVVESNEEQLQEEQNRREVIALHKERVLEKEKIGAFILQANQIYQLNKNCNMDEFLKLCICLDPLTIIEEKVCGKNSLFKREDLLKIPPKVFLEDLSAEHRRVCIELEEEAKRLNINGKRLPFVETIPIKNSENTLKRVAVSTSSTINIPAKRPCLEKSINTPVIQKTTIVSRQKSTQCPSSFLPPSSLKSPTTTTHSTVIKPVVRTSINGRELIPPKMILIQKTTPGQLQSKQDNATVIFPKIEKRIPVQSTAPVVLPTKVIKPILVNNKNEIKKIASPVVLKRSAVVKLKNDDKNLQGTQGTLGKTCKSRKFCIPVLVPKSVVSMTRSQIEEQLRAFKAASNVSSSSSTNAQSNTSNEVGPDSSKPGPSGVKIRLSNKDIEILRNKGKSRSKKSTLDIVNNIKDKFEKDILNEFNVELTKMENIVDGKESNIIFENGTIETNNLNFRNGFSKKKKNKDGEKMMKKMRKKVKGRERKIKFKDNVGVHYFTPVGSEDEYIEPPIPVLEQISFVEDLIKKVIFTQNTSQKQKNEALVRLNSKLEDKQNVFSNGVDENDILKSDFISQLISFIIQFKKKLTILDNLTEEVNEETGKLDVYSDAEKLKYRFKVQIKNELLKLDEERKKNTYDRLKSKKIDRLTGSNCGKDDQTIVSARKDVILDIPDDVDLRKEDLQCHELIDGRDVSMEDDETVVNEEKNLQWDKIKLPKDILKDNLKYLTKKQASYIYNFSKSIPTSVKKIVIDSSPSVYDAMKMDYIVKNPSLKNSSNMKIPKSIDILLKTIKRNELGIPIFKSRRDLFICKVFLKRFILSKLYSIAKKRTKLLEGIHSRIDEIRKRQEYERELQIRKHNREKREIKIDVDYMRKFMTDKIMSEYETEKKESMKRMLEKLDCEEQYQYNELKEWSLNRDLNSKYAPPRHTSYLRRNLVDSKNIIETTRRGAKKKVVVEDPIPHYMLPCSSVRIDKDIELLEKEWKEKQASLKIDEEPVIAKPNARGKKPNTITVIYEENRVIRDGKMFYIHQNVFCEFRHIGQMMCYMFLINKDECFLRSRLLGDTRIFCVSKKDLETGRVVFKRKASQKKTPKDPNEPSPPKARAKRGGRTSRGGRGARGRRGATRARGGRGNRGGRR
uniref:GLTSCR1 domain-containing protein n=1 Tax=Strongyloides papillosus TaxID=174720 RepID=A0A0N5C4A2_STREA